MRGKTPRMKKLLFVIAVAISVTSYSQNVGIGETSPANKFSVKGNLSVGAGYSTTAAPTNGAIVQGNVGIGTASPAYTLDVTGVINAATGFKVAGGTPTTGTYLKGNGTNFVAGTIATADVPTLNQNTTGSAASFTGSLAGDVTGIQGATVVGKINGISFSGLGTGILKNTTGSGVPSIAVAADFPTLPYVDLANAQTAAGAKTWSGNAVFSSGSVSMTNATSNLLAYSTAGVAAPAFTTRSLGTRIVFYPQLDATDLDYAMGIASNTLWYTVPQATSTYQHAFYAGTSELMRIRGDGNVGIGTASPGYKLDVNGTANVGGVLTLGSTVSSPKFRVTNVWNQNSTLPGASSFTSGGGTLVICASGSGFSSTTSVVGMNILVDGVNKGVCKTYTNETSSHKAFNSNFLVLSGIASGSHTIQLTVISPTQTDFNDFFSLSVMELPF